MIDWRPYMRAPYKLGGRSFEGMDCYGLLYLVYKHEYDIEIEKFEGMYNEETVPTVANELVKLESAVGANWREVTDTLNWKEGLGVVMWTETSTLVQHIGVLAAEPWGVVTTLAGQGFQRFGWGDDPIGKFIKSRVVGFYEWNQC